ncbi:MAG TPA: glycoside hydrolase family 20 zincin-like fold domain-containing protein, partial [Steroidobacteraceae bacterium]|nr:glycoside hydrolase family 20 zincin-like fold domain-containing protein [Steroidobacteraceae bacterium]
MANVANLASRRAHWALALVAIIPAPREVVETGGKFTVAPGVSLTTRGDVAAQQVAVQFAERLARHPGIQVSLPVASSAPSASAGAPRIVFELQPETNTPAEAYRLVVTPDAATVTAGDVAGLRHGAVTLWQLVATSAASATPGVAIRPV